MGSRTVTFLRKKFLCSRILINSHSIHYYYSLFVYSFIVCYEYCDGSINITSLEKLLEQRKILRNLQQDNKQDQLRKTYTKMNEQINVVQFKSNKELVTSEKISLNVKEEKLNYKDQIIYCQKARDNLKYLFV